MLAADVLDAARHTGRQDRLGNTLIFINCTWECYQAEHGPVSLSDFKVQLLELHLSQALSLAEADMPQTLDADNLSVSMTHYRSSSFVFVRLPEAYDEYPRPVEKLYLPPPGTTDPVPSVPSVPSVPQPSNRPLSEVVSALRRRLGISKVELARKLGVNRKSIGRWESGATVPNADQLAAIQSLDSPRTLQQVLLDAFIDHQGRQPTPAQLELLQKVDECGGGQ